jgi:hypothetical protein
MKAGLEERVRGLGHWRVNIRPLQPLPEKMTLAQCKNVVEQASVSIRGWDFPHIARRQDDEGGYVNAGEYVENWCDWRQHIEFWRMYRSGQFLSYKTLWEDVADEERPRPPGPLLSVVGAIYSITEFVEFTHRLFSNGLYQEGGALSVTLGGAEGRQLWISQGDRMPFIDERRTQAPSISLQRDIEPEVLASSHLDVSLNMLLELFDHFGWNPDPGLVRADQEKFYRREWY